MQYCNHCKVHIRGTQSECPLCENAIVASEEQEQIFPIIPVTYERHLAIRIMVFLSITTVLISFAVNILFPTKFNQPLFIMFGLLSAWVSLIFVIRKRHNIPKTIIWQVTIVSMLSIFWDWQTGWKAWSLEFVIPIAYVSVILVMFVTAKIIKLSVRDYITYALLDCLFGIIPVLFILFGWVNILYPSIICVTISVIFLSAIFIFQGENIKSELNKRMHI